MLSFEEMSEWTLGELRAERDKLREELRKEIQRRDSLKAEIMWLEREIKKLREME